jgi:hypothetical protein
MPLLSYEEVKKRFQQFGFVLLSEKYEGAKKPLEYRCTCGKIDTTIISTLKKHHNGCKECSARKKKEIFMKKYGVDNPMKDPNIREKFKNTCIEKYGVDNPMKDPNVREKTKTTCIEKYGVDTPLKNSNVREKVKNTCMEKYGVDSASKNRELYKDAQKKCKQTMLQKYGVDYPMEVLEFRNKQKATWVQNYGVDHPMKDPVISKKVKQTCIEKYGVDNAMKNPIVFKKYASSLYKHYLYEFPYGKKSYIQGYEKYALDELIKMGYNENEIECGNSEKIPHIPYEFEDMFHMFYPDIFIPNENRIIEVKSEYTYERDIEKNAAKIVATPYYGYDIEFWIYNKQGEIVEMIDIS